MPRYARRTTLAAALAAAAAAALPGRAAAVDVPARTHRFLSAPDLFNGDIADLRQGNTFWEPGDPNSWNESHRAAIEGVFTEFAAMAPDAFLMAGDAVQGHWGRDEENTGIFGPTDTYANKVKALHRAANTYYGAWRDNFSRHGIPMSRVHAALGDHELCDNPWPADTFKHDAFYEFKKAWARHFTDVWGNGNRYAEHPVGTGSDDTAYATWLSPDLLLVTVDTFKRDATGVRITVEGAQLAWLRRVLAAARATNPVATIMVQGHVPVLLPVRTRGSSGLCMEGGEGSGFWQALREFRVDVYLCGEVHANTAIQTAPGEPLQLAHGGLFAWGATNYVIGDLFDDGTLRLELRRFAGSHDTTYLWQTGSRIAEHIKVDTPSYLGGVITMKAGVIGERTGEWLPYTP